MTPPCELGLSLSLLRSEHYRSSVVYVSACEVGTPVTPPCRVGLPTLPIRRRPLQWSVRWSLGWRAGRSKGPAAESLERVATVTAPVLEAALSRDSSRRRLVNYRASVFDTNYCIVYFRRRCYFCHWRGGLSFPSDGLFGAVPLITAPPGEAGWGGRKGRDFTIRVTGPNYLCACRQTLLSTSRAPRLWTRETTRERADVLT